MLSRATFHLRRNSAFRAQLFCAQKPQVVAAVPGVEPASALDFVLKQWPALSSRLIDFQCHEVMMQIRLLLQLKHVPKVICA